MVYLADPLFGRIDQRHHFLIVLRFLCRQHIVSKTSVFLFQPENLLHQILDRVETRVKSFAKLLAQIESGTRQRVFELIQSLLSINQLV